MKSHKGTRSKGQSNEKGNSDLVCKKWDTKVRLRGKGQILTIQRDSADSNLHTFYPDCTASIYKQA